MGKNLLRAPLVKSAVLLLVFSLLVYLTATSPDGSVWAALGKIFQALFSAAQLAVGLVLAMAICFLVLMIIFFGGLALISRDSAADMYDRFLQSASAKLVFLKSLIIPTDRAMEDSPAKAWVGQFKDEIRSEIELIKTALRSDRDALEQSGANLRERVEELEGREDVRILAERLDKLEEQVDNIVVAMEAIQADDRVAGLSARLEVCEQGRRDSAAQVERLGRDFGQLRDQLAPAKESVVTAAGEEATELPRLFAYIEDQEIRETIRQRVDEALARDMTYALATDYVIEGLDGKTGKILRDHPSLTKEFIRSRRQKS